MKNIIRSRNLLIGAAIVTAFAGVGPAMFARSGAAQAQGASAT